MNLLCCIGKNANDKITINWTPDLDVMFLQVYLEVRKYDPLSRNQIVQFFSGETGLKLSWRIIVRRIDYLNSLQESLLQLCTPDPETGILIMTKEASALATKKHPELSNPNSKQLVELLLQKTTPTPLSCKEPRPKYNSNPNSSGLDVVDTIMMF
ncbi:unnamed protein product [Eruca vesicaria subsp. sativa]|uniref:Uncharacterized protein n=1 Tax=Eruca vesicaria subsp. sativa TaxID=29727 RepID=A0ABC8LQP5_ERUVS|nr:unnamed protein product [Eruca vesicaria subsp. sativa]